MKKKFTISTIILGLSVVAGSAYAASNDDLWGTTNSSEPVSLEVLAKEKGITLDELVTQLEKEGNLEEAVPTTKSIGAVGTIESTNSEITASSESVSLEEIAKEKGITVDELVDQLEKEGNLMQTETVTSSVEAKNNNQ